jgi:cell division septation protein DedD
VKDVDIAVLPGPQTASPSRATAESPAEPKNLFTVQVAASTSARYAVDMVRELKGAGHAAYVVGPQSGPYHVRVGQYPTLAEASRSARSLEKALGWKMSVTIVSSE